MRKEIDINTAKEQLKEINKLLTSGHVLIGGLAVQQYYKTRETKDIDLVCDSATAKRIIDKLYPSKDYQIDELNDDEYRPSFEITHKINKNKIVFFGPKILERESYKSIDWEKLNKNSTPFQYRKDKYENIRVPQLESLAFIKLLSFVDRITGNKLKGERDLIDFIELTNNDAFRMNDLINQIRESHTESYIRNKLTEALDYDTSIWNNSLFIDFFRIVMPALESIEPSDSVFDDNFKKVYTVDEAVDFYQIIANKYDERNTNVVWDTHRQVILAINEKLNKRKEISVLDIGSGTGRLIATHYFDTDNVHWSCIEPSSEMSGQFSENMKLSRVNYKIHDCSIFEPSDEVDQKKYDVIILSLVLSSLPKNPDFSYIFDLMEEGGALLITDFYESCPYYDFHLNNKRIALYTRKVQFIEILKTCMSLGLSLVLLDTIENRAGKENTFILKMLKPSSS